jgi:hypothetical protein
MTTTMTQVKAANRIDWHTQEWIKGVGQMAALMKFNGATREQVAARVDKDYPEYVDYQAYLSLAREAYRALWAELADHDGKGFVACLSWDGSLDFARADRLAEIPDASWNWVKQLRGV